MFSWASASFRVVAAEMFEAGQILVRPGVAQTQAVLARDLSGGSDEAAQLLDDWGWSGNAFRDFIVPEDGVVCR